MNRAELFSEWIEWKLEKINELKNDVLIIKKILAKFIILTKVKIIQKELKLFREQKETKNRNIYQKESNSIQFQKKFTKFVKINRYLLIRLHKNPESKI